MGTLAPLQSALLFMAIGFSCFLFGLSNGEVTGTALTFPINCKPYHQRGMKFMLKNFNKCSRELKANSTSDKDYEENIGCALKCTMRNTGYSEENDLVTEASMKRAVGTILPTALVEPVVQTLWNKCHSKYGEKLDPNEAQCKAYSEYAFCIQTTIADLVESEEYEMFCIKDEKKKKKS